MVPVVQDALLQVDDSRAEAMLPDFAEDHSLGHRVIGNLLGQSLRVLGRVSQPLGVCPRLVEVEEDEKEPVRRRQGEHMRVVLVVHDRQISVPELRDWAGRDHKALPVGSDGCGFGRKRRRPSVTRLIAEPGQRE